MSITDRELILGAARAAGYTIQEGADVIFRGNDFPESSVRYGQIRYAVWNPLESNDDALALMCDMELTVAVSASDCSVISDSRYEIITHEISDSTDCYAMCRRAIVNSCYNALLKVADDA